MDKVTKPEVGMGVTVRLYTDQQAYTVTRVSPTGKSFWAKPDVATLVEGWKPEWVPGGFAGHVTNNHDQKYTYEMNNNADEVLFRLTKKGKWSLKGSTRVSLGHRNFFHDYNF